MQAATSSLNQRTSRQAPLPLSCAAGCSRTDPTLGSLRRFSSSNLYRQTSELAATPIDRESASLRFDSETASVPRQFDLRAGPSRQDAKNPPETVKEFRVFLTGE